MKKWQAFKVYVGPCIVEKAVEICRGAGLDCDGGTEHIYVSGPEGNVRDAVREQIYQKLLAKLGKDHFLTREFR